MKIFKTVLPLLCMIALTGCGDNSTGDEPIIEPAGSAHYLINNQTTQKLTIVFTTSAALGAKVDSSTVGQDSSKKILEDGIIGVNPTPSRSLSKIVLYNAAPDSLKAVLTIDPVDDSPWNIIAEEGFDGSNYGLREYELVITEEDIK